jgi:integrase
MAGDAFHLRLSGHRRLASADGGHRLGARDAGTDLDSEARNGGPSPAARGKYIGFRQGPSLPRRRESGALAWASRQAVARAFQGTRGRTPRRTTVYVPAFLASLRKREAVSARALEFLIVTAGRTGEVIGAHWSEISLLDKTWTVPATRMKAHREHRVPLSPRALVILQEMHKARDGHDGFVFPGPRPGKPLSNVAFLRLLRRMGLRDLTVHGFRATFKTWASERTSFQNEIVEASLAHTIGGKVEQAYLRGDMFDKRRRLMQQWATFCTTAPAQGNVTPLRRKI